MKRFLFWLSGLLPCRIICDGDRPYLERYYLFTLLGVRFYLHRFVGSDPGRGLHDHPWPWAGAVVLSGYYLEERRGLEQHAITQAMAEVFGTTGTTRTKVRWFNWLTGDTFHRVVLPVRPVRLVRDGKYIEQVDEPCWTLFFHRATNTKPWGFLRQTIDSNTTRVWVPHNWPKDGSGTPGAWWNEVPIGNLETRRQPCQ